MTKRYGVVLTFDGRRTTGYAGRFKRLPEAMKERDRQAAVAWFRVEEPSDLLRSGSFRYCWRVWDHWTRCFADRSLV